MAASSDLVENFERAVQAKIDEAVKIKFSQVEDRISFLERLLKFNGICPRCSGKVTREAVKNESIKGGEGMNFVCENCGLLEMLCLEEYQKQQIAETLEHYPPELPPLVMKNLMRDIEVTILKYLGKRV